MLASELIKIEKRISNRLIDQERDISFAHYENYLVVRCEKSCICMYYSKNITKPYLDRPSEGCFQLTLDRARKNDSLMNFLHRIYISSKCIAMEDLCIKFNQEVYSINIDIYPIQTDGNLFKMCVEGINQVLKILEIKTYFNPICHTFASLEDTIVTDPTEMELSQSSWSAIAVMRSSRELIFLEKKGCETLPDKIFSIFDKIFLMKKV